jgi:hypothetical protein
MVMTAARSTRTRLSGMVRVAFVLALAGAIAVLSGGMLFLSAGSAGSAPTATDTTCVPSEAWTETTDWVLAAPGDGWRQVDQRTVVDEAAWTEETFLGWQHYSWTGGPLEAGVVPAVPTGPDDPDWQANATQEPHADNPHVTWLDGTGWGLHYMSHDSAGRADWFYLQRLTEVVEHPAVTHVELRYAFDHPAVVCPTPPTTQPPTTQPPEVLPTTATSPEPAQQPAQEQAPEQAQGPVQEPVQGADAPADDVEVLGAQASQPQPPSTQVPTAVDAGLSASTVDGAPAGQLWGLGLVAGGLVLLSASGGVLARIRRS